MSNINDNKRLWHFHNPDTDIGTIAWREYLDSLGFSGHSIVEDTKALLIDGGYWVGNINESLKQYYLTRWCYTFDGIDDYITIPTVSLVSGDIVEFEFITVPTGGEFLALIFGNFRMHLQSSGALWWTDNVDVYANGNIIAPAAFFPEENGNSVSIMIVFKGINDISIIGSNAGTSRYYNSVIVNLVVTAASGNRFYPLDDGWDNSPVIRDTLGTGSTDGTAVNFNEAQWNYV